MTKEEHINYWITNSQKDWRRSKRCFTDKDYLFCLFCLHLSFEKIIKGLWVKYNDNYKKMRTKRTAIKVIKDFTAACNPIADWHLLSLVKITNPKFTDIEPHPYSVKDFYKSDPFIEEIKKTGLEINI